MRSHPLRVPSLSPRWKILGLLGLTFALLAPAAGADDAESRHVLLIAGRPSHGYGAHEHYAGSRVLADTIERAAVGVTTEVVRGWPEDATKLERADAIVIYSDGGGGHPALPHREAIGKLMEQGKGFVCIHYAVEVPKGEPGDDFLEWLGGYFETHWSVNPHWDAEFTELPEHPITRGVETPFTVHDEWYFHMRFRPAMEGVTPILSAVAPESTMRRPDGPHSGNPTVRRAVAEGEPQHLAWAFERPDGGRSFGFTGGHFHWNWGRPEMRRLVANAIVWSAGAEVPEGGIELEPIGVTELEKDQDFDPPGDHSPEAIGQRYGIEKSAEEEAKQEESGDSAAKPRRLHRTPVVTSQTPGHQLEIEVPLEDTRDLYLVVDDAGDGFSCDWANWIDPVISGEAGEKSLVDLDWKSATSDWGQVRKNRNAEGRPLSVAGRPVTVPGIGTHANSVIHYRLPEGFDRFRVTAALDTGGVSQQGGRATSVRFSVYADAPPPIATGGQEGDASELRDPAHAVDGLDVAEGLEVTLSASEPDLVSLTNLDIDDRGRVWVCEVVNYRSHRDRRPEGDRILILEDTTGDGVLDDVKVYYQGRDIDSAMGICVLGNQVIVSGTPTILRFTDETGNDRPDRKEVLFADTGQPQHDHSNHSFLFGPDGNLYWNFGNTGQAVKDAQGEVVVDIHGREVVDNGRPFFGGMVFRCNLDGGDFEVLAHNFRNNYETTVDSFGTLWQSDNDDDGHRAVRINWVMEHGNYGYREERTGASWQAPRIGMHPEVPHRHWHINDPGVVPNLLVTGAGSPTGICIYEGSLLPERFQNQMIHCDAGPNVVRSYPVERQGAGYTAEIEPILVGTRDRWFRPADVCVAPDGSLFVTDWYDPGVGGHRMEDLERGRVFRIAPPNTPYRVPQYDYSTAAGAAEALRNPNLSVRYKAWMALHAMGEAAEPELLKLWAEADPRLRARALWLLGKIPGRGGHYVATALEDDEADLRITALRLARQIGEDLPEVVARVVEDPSPAVRAEAAVALRFDRSEAMPALWARLASHHDGDDRWYLEALGIGSDLRAEECYAAWRVQVGDDWDTPAGRDIVWRTRAAEAAELLAQVIRDPALSLEQTDRYFRSLEFHAPQVRSAALQKMLEPVLVSLADADDSLRQRNEAIVVRAVERIDDYDWRADDAVRQTVMRHLDRQRGTPEYLALVKRLQPEGLEAELFELALAHADNSTGVEAIALVAANRRGARMIRESLEGEDGERRAPVARLLGLWGSRPAIRWLSDLAAQDERDYETRAAAVRALAASNLGAGRLLEMTEQGSLPADVRLLAGGLLVRSDDGGIRQRAEQLLPLPTREDLQPLPPIDQLAALEGDPRQGEILFRNKATCANCHVVNGHGKQVGPDLSEIGSKLSREAMYVSILDPSAGISHNYENYIALLEDGQVISGILVDQTEEAVTLRTAEAIDRRIARAEIEELKKSDKSIMPDNLHQTIDLQGLVDIVQYMTTLETKSGEN